jgi:hypothetical protein
MDSVLASGQTKDYTIGTSCFPREARSIEEKDQRLVDSESELCVQVEWHVYPQTVVSVSQRYEKPTQLDGVLVFVDLHIVERSFCRYKKCITY